MHGEEFWRGYVAALDDAQAAFLRAAADVNRPLSDDWFRDVRHKFALRAHVVEPAGPTAGDGDLDRQVRDTLTEQGIPEAQITELLILARRAGREASAATKPSPGAHPSDQPAAR